ncbi:hypothetical protein F2Q69_00013387 [Brassica cretica]|uniref:Uncharacterized protein n=1 Tax=Brassica cretica TaxID=69181 RepID=A0A8S9R717_BRACR|nr:hypothetical protein F2Q69_00013387 [Brassica cretica]
MRHFFVGFSVCPLSGFSTGVSGSVMAAWLYVVSRTSLLFFRSFRLSDEGSLEEGALVSGVGLFSFWSFVLGVLVLAWYLERMVPVCLVLCCCVGHYIAYSLLCLVSSWRKSAGSSMIVQHFPFQGLSTDSNVGG